MQPSKPLFSVIIPHLNQLDQLELCLASLDAQTLAHTLFETIVVDNGSILPPNSVVTRHSGTRLLHERRPGPGLARNRGVQAASGEFICFIDADCRAHPEWLRTAAKIMSSAPERIILG